MWSYKKKKGIDFPSGNIEFEFVSSWRHDKREVAVMTENCTVILNEKNKFFMEISGENLNPVKIQIVPDFKNRKLNFIEIIDANIATDNSKGKISFIDTNSPTRNVVSPGEYLKRYNENLDKFGKEMKRGKRTRNIITLASTIFFFFNLYLFTTNSWPLRYISLVSMVILAYAIYHLWKSYKGAYKEYENCKEMQDQIFGTVKEK